jgi:uncharacterized protein (TIGR02117 family)
MKLVAWRVTRIVAAIAALPIAYVAAGLIGGAIPANNGWRAPDDGVVIFVETNGIHTGLVLPKVAAGVDWRGLARARDLGDPRYAVYPYIAVGWGDRAFYLGTPTWADVKPGTALAAAIGSEHTLLHVDHIPRPRPAADERAIVLRPDEYRRLAAFVRASVRAGGHSYRGYDAYDAFYDATGRYSALRTCNAWTGEALRAAGVRVGRWTPFPVTVTWWF